MRASSAQGNKAAESLYTEGIEVMGGVEKLADKCCMSSQSCCLHAAQTVQLTFSHSLLITPAVANAHDPAAGN